MKSELSNDFAMRVIDKELELEGNCNLLNLNMVVELYREAIEYFEEQKNPKFWDFQERLQNLLMKPHILKLMNYENQKYKRANKSNKLKVKTQENNIVESLINLENNFNQKSPVENTQVIEEISLLEEKPTKIITRIVETQQNRTKDVTGKVNSDIKSQELSLKERLNYRRQRSITKSTDSCFVSFTTKDLNSCYNANPNNSTLSDLSQKNIDDSPFFKEFESDISAGIENINNKQEALQKVIEKIMEENYAEKTEKITEIKIRYESQINEMDNMGYVFDEAVDNLKKKMDAEINQVNEILDSKRKKLISISKSELNFR